MAEESTEQKKYKRGENPNSLKNLEKRVKFKPGQSGHPQGESLTACLQRMILKPVSKPDAKTAPAKELIVYQAIVGAITGKPIQFKEVWERMEGKLGAPLIDARTSNYIITPEIVKALQETVREIKTLELKAIENGDKG